LRVEKSGGGRKREKGRRGGGGGGGGEKTDLQVLFLCSNVISDNEQIHVTVSTMCFFLPRESVPRPLSPTNDDNTRQVMKIFKTLGAPSFNRLVLGFGRN